MPLADMPAQLTLGAVDQSPMRRGGTAADALRDTVALAQAVERLGYARFWVAEHHNAGTFVGTSPEILVGQILAQTHHIHVGSGGVMLSHYAALKVAEQFRVLDSFYPGRVDLGIGRAPGSDQLTMHALAYPKPPADIRHFPQQVTDLLAWLHDGLAEPHPFAKVRAQPGPPAQTAPEVWLLGSSDYSAQLAAELGLPFAFADFFGNPSEYGPVVAELYRRNFKPSRFLAAPRLNVTLQVLCAPTAEEARYLGGSRNMSKMGQVLGLREGLLPPEEAAALQAKLTPQQLQFQDAFRKAYIDGDPDQVKRGIIQAAARYGTTDVSIVTICHDLVHRIRSFELIAAAFGLRAD